MRPALSGLTFVSKCWSAFCSACTWRSMIIDVIAPIFTVLLEHLRAFEATCKRTQHCWSNIVSQQLPTLRPFAQSLKEPVKCGLSEMNNVIGVNKSPWHSFPRLEIFRLCVGGNLDLNKLLTHGENFWPWIVANGVGDLTLFEALAGGVCDHLNYQHTREFGQNLSKKKVRFPGVCAGAWVVLLLTGTLCLRPYAGY